ncbi:pyridoxamine 5'-phosphate oxidase family protein [Brevundimonas sp. BR2-1]|uniref:pyridoxamine 5'-phosphate oxidase family protein n=1 Tax=unclassified Brevundimonas TaxID=2622653 RepID=UPI002FCC894B
MSAAVPIHGRAVTAVVDLLDHERLMTLACNRPDGWPQATTVGYLNEGLNLYFIVARTSQKFANLQADPRASVAIRSESGSRGDGVGVSMAGRVAEVVDPVAVERLNRQVIERYPDVHAYCPSGDSVAVLHFRPGVISAVGVTGGRSEAETFTVGAEHDGVSQLF